MPVFIVEDGTGLPDSNSFSSVDDANAILESAGASDNWSLASIEKKQQALVVATSYIESVFGDRFSGVRAVLDQALSWPRVGAVAKGIGCIDSDIVPKDVIACTAQLAETSLEQNLYDFNTDEDGLVVKSFTNKVEGISESKTYAINDGSSTSQLTNHPQIFGKLKKYTTGKQLFRG